jgi:hypothetical protein
MEDNPFAGTEFEQSWSEGFLAAFADPDDDISAPSPLTLEQQEVYLQGVSAGRKAGAGWRPPHAPPTDLSSDWEEHAAKHTVLSVGGHLAKRAPLFGPTGAEVAGVLSEVAFGVFFSIAIWGPADVPTWDEGAVEILDRMRQQLADEGLVEDNVEPFMPACLLTEHQVTDDDELTRLGSWHGRVYADFDSALEEANEHGHSATTRILRYQSAFL